MYRSIIKYYNENCYAVLFYREDDQRLHDYSFPSFEVPAKNFEHAAEIVKAYNAEEEE